MTDYDSATRAHAPGLPGHTGGELHAPGPIIISRHGRPALDRTAGPRLGWRDYRSWWANYEAGSLAPGQTPPQRLLDIVADARTVLTSQRPRAIETARMAAPHMQAVQDPLFNEAPLPPPRLPALRYLPRTWNVLARAAWLRGHSLDGESVSEARARAKMAAAHLDTAAQSGKVYLAAHGWFNRMLRPQLRVLGWRCVEDLGDGYWCHRVYAYLGDQDGLR